MGHTDIVAKEASIRYNLQPMAGQKYYAVVAGRKPGIYTQWSGPGGAEEQVKGFAGAKFRGFTSREEAQAFLRSGGVQLAPELPLPAARLAGTDRPKAERGMHAYEADLQAGKVVIFTDGACTGNPGPGGYGVVILFRDAHTAEITRREISAGFRRTTNNRMEILACIMALRSLPQRSQVVLYSDSRYVVDAVTKGWARRWRSNDWLRAPDDNGRRARAENVDLWEQMLDLLDQHQVEFRWVKGHAQNPENERCDRLAVQAAHQPNLPVDQGFN
jgi:ribonuclease HI